jgi:hypothetical protein
MIAPDHPLDSLKTLDLDRATSRRRRPIRPKRDRREAHRRAQNRHRLLPPPIMDQAPPDPVPA